MTVLTKPSGQKKAELGAVVAIPTAPTLESGTAPLTGRNVVLIRRRANSQATTLLLLLIALLVMCIGIIGGVIIYRQYSLQRWQRMRFHGLCRIPYETDMMDSESMLAAQRELMNTQLDGDENWIHVVQQFFNDIPQLGDSLFNEGKNFVKDLEGSSDDSSEKTNKTDNEEEADFEKFMKEEFELDITDDQSFSKIQVPQLTTGRGATFLHDFKSAQTGIIDRAANRCFVMPLDLDVVMPPRGMADLIQKMQTGYYNVDTKVLRKNMRVKVPALTDMSSVAPRIASECRDMNVYELEKLQSGVFKRSVTNPATYSEYAGKGFEEIQIANLAELDAYEKAETK